MAANDYIPQFPDGSGWDLEGKYAPTYFYEHISQAEVRKLKRATANQLYKIVCIVPLTEQPHKNTYFVKGSRLSRFLEGFSECAEYIISIERVESMPSFDEKLRQ